LYLDERPRVRGKDLYGMEGGLRELLDAINSRKPLILLRGTRRLGENLPSRGASE